MALTSGREEFAVAFVGKDEVSAMITELQSKLKGLEGQARAAGTAGGAAATGLKGIGQSMQSATSGATAFKGGLSAIKENILGLPGLVGGIIGTFGALGIAIAEALKPDKVKAFDTQFNASIDAIEKRVAGLVKAIASTGSGKSASTAELGARSEIQDQVALSDALIKHLELRQRLIPELQREALAHRDVRDTAAAGYLALEAETRKIGGDLEKLNAQHDRAVRDLLSIDLAVIDVENDKLSALVLQAIEADKITKALETQTRQAWLLLAPMKSMASTMAGVFGQIAAGSMALGGGKAANDEVSKALLKPAKTPGAGGGEKAEKKADRMAKEVMDAWRTEDIAGVEHTIQVFAQKEARKEAEAQASALADSTWAELEMLWGAEEKAAARRKPIDDIAELTQALSGLRDIIPEVAIPFETLATSFSAAADAGATLTEATLSSVGPTLKAFGAVAKGKREGFFLDGLGELAEAAKAFATPGMQWSGVGHLGAAAGFFYAAGKSGGKGGGSRGTGPTGGAGPRGGAAANDNEGAPKTVVYNISAGVMDGQSVQRAIVRAEGSARGTGWESRRGW